jgi:hypothetical protein
VVLGYSTDNTTGKAALVDAKALNSSSVGSVYFLNNSKPQPITVTATLPPGGQPQKASFVAEFPQTSFQATTCQLGVVSRAGFFADGAFVILGW